MTTQGTNTAKSRKSGDSTDLDLDAWLVERKLTERRMKVGGKWFRFTGSATSDQIAEFSEAVKGGKLLDMMRVLLVDPDELGELEEAFKVQRQPLDAEREAQFLNRIVNHLITGADVGESSAS